MKKNLHIHLDPIGGISGDMFISAMIDADPSLKNAAKDLSRKLIKDIKLTIKKSKSNHISGTRFIVNLSSENNNHHRTYNNIKDIIAKSSLSITTKEISLSLFQKLALAEAEVHGIELNEVSFHELGAWDSIIDNVIAAFIINKYEKKYNVSWSCSPVPIGKGIVHTAHGNLSIPAPATSLLLNGIAIIDDGIEGERTTPTGAAIISHINPYPNISSAETGNLNIYKQGIGIGTKKFKTIPNILRILIFKEAKKLIKNSKNEVISQINFDIDDQSPEDLALSLNIISKDKNVIDIVQHPIVGKKGRVTINVKLLCKVQSTEDIIEQIFNETSTIGVRHLIVGRYILERKIDKISHFNIKKTKRPSGKITKKVESNDLKNYSYKNRKSIKSKIEMN
jgi:pyridinium-3,5-bisthiocarboxylic acid mononucleotide nickel chelatase